MVIAYIVQHSTIKGIINLLKDFTLLDDEIVNFCKN